MALQVIDGELIESRFAWPDQDQILGANKQEMCRLSDTRMAPNDVLYINGECVDGFGRARDTGGREIWHLTSEIVPI